VLVLTSSILSSVGWTSPGRRQEVHSPAWNESADAALTTLESINVLRGR
jgi:hypothetical protein